MGHKGGIFCFTPYPAAVLDDSGFYSLCSLTNVRQPARTFYTIDGIVRVTITETSQFSVHILVLKSLGVKGVLTHNTATTLEMTNRWWQTPKIL